MIFRLNNSTGIGALITAIMALVTWIIRKFKK